MRTPSPSCTRSPSRSRTARRSVSAPPATVRQRFRPKPSMRWWSKKRIAYAAGKLERPLGRRRPERRGERHEVVRSGSAASTRARSRTPRASAPRSRPRRASAARCGASARPRRGARGSAGRPPAGAVRTGGVPTTRGRSWPQLTENDISAGCTCDAELAEQPRQERVVRLVVDDEARVEGEAPACCTVRTCPPARARALEDGDVVRAREQRRRPRGRSRPPRSRRSASSVVRPARLRVGSRRVPRPWHPVRLNRLPQRYDRSA